MRCYFASLLVLALAVGCQGSGSVGPADDAPDGGSVAIGEDAATGDPRDPNVQPDDGEPSGHAGGPSVPADAPAQPREDAGTAQPPTTDAGQSMPTSPGDAGQQTLDATVNDASASAGGDPDASAPVDAGTSELDAAAGSDAATPVDAGAAADSGEANDAGETDAGFDAGEGAAIDAGASVDAGDDAGSDAGSADAGDDAGSPVDAGSADAGDDASVDAGPAADGGDDGPVDAGSDAGSGPTCSGPPGLYADTHCSVLASGVRAYRPQYPLWSDGAVKERFVYLPPDTTIDTTNPDRWNFPAGTRFYKSFSAGTQRIETRVIEKTGSGASIDNWTLRSYAWSADGLSVSVAATGGVSNALGSGLDIPSQAQCRTCHNMTGADAVIGFGAIQLNHDPDGITLSTLIDEGLLRNGSASASLNVSVSNARIPGDSRAQAALGYVHGNCGHCHGGPTPRAGQSLWSKVGMTELSDAPIFQTAVCHCLEFWRGRSNPDGDDYELRVSPSHAVLSGIVGRMSSRIAGEQMPPLGTKRVDETGLATIKTWIDSLDPASCGSSAPVCR